MQRRYPERYRRGIKRSKKMEIHNGIVYVSGPELIRSETNPDGVMSEAYYKKLRGSKRLQAKHRACYGKSALIAYDSLPDKYRAMLASRYGDPAEEVRRRQERRNTIGYDVTIDLAADAYYRGYIVPETGKHLPEKSIIEYVNGASVLNAVIDHYKNRIPAIRRLGGSLRPVRGQEIERYLKYAEALNEAFPNQLPSSRRILAVLNAYLPGWDGYGDAAPCRMYGTLIKAYQANANRAKISDEAADWLVARYGAPMDRVTLAQLHDEYNAKCGEMGWKRIASPKTLRSFLNQPDVKPLWAAMRYGELKTKDLQVRQHRTRLPEKRDTLWYSDGTKLNYYYQDENGRMCTCNVYEVIDAYSEVLLGFHISQSEDFEAQYFAYKMAVETSQHRPYEIKYDNQGGHKKLEAANFLTRLARISSNTAPYNGRSKTIENIFKRFQESFLHRDWFFSGQNITTKKEESRANMEYILANKSALPSLADIKALYEKRREQWNAAPHPKTGRARIDMYRESVNEGAPELTFEQYVDMFWLETARESRYAASGIEIRVNNTRYAYEVNTADGMPDLDFLRENNGRRFVVKYDPSDMSVVQLCERSASGLRVVAYAEPYRTIHRAAQEQTEGERAFIARMDAEGKAARLQTQSRMEAILERWGYHPAQHGMRMPRILGVSAYEKENGPAPRARKAKPKEVPMQSFGQYQKEVSNISLSNIIG